MIAILVVIYVVFISLGLPDSLFGVAWPVLGAEFGLPTGFASVYSTIVGICTGGASFVAGFVIRKFGTPLVSLASIILTAVGLIGISLSPNIWVMIFFAIVLGYGAGAIDTGLNNYVSLHYKARHMNWLHCFWGIGVTASPMIMSLFLGGENGSWRNGYRVVAALELLIGVVVLFALKKWRSLDTTALEEPEKKKEKSVEKPHIFKIPGMIPSILSLGFYCSMEFILGTWGASYFVNVFSLGADVAARYVSMYFGGIMLGRFITGFVSIKLGDKTIIRAGLIVMLCGFAVLLSQYKPLMFPALLLVGVGCGPIFPSILHSVPERFGTKFSADITGFHMGGAYAVGFSVQMIFGFVAAATTFRIMPAVLISLCVLAVCMNETAVRKIDKSLTNKV